MTVESESRLGKADRFYINPNLRDAEWNRAKQPSWLLIVAAIVIIGVAFYFGFYGSGGERVAGWAIGLLAIVGYALLNRLRRDAARRQLRRVHGGT